MATSEEIEDGYRSTQLLIAAVEMAKPLAEKRKVSNKAFMSEGVIAIVGKIDFLAQWMPHMSVLSVTDDILTIFDKSVTKSADISFQKGKVYCGLCKSLECEHVGYALATPDLGKAWLNHIRGT